MNLLLILFFAPCLNVIFDVVKSIKGRVISPFFHSLAKLEKCQMKTARFNFKANVLELCDGRQN